MNYKKAIIAEYLSLRNAVQLSAKLYSPSHFGRGRRGRGKYKQPHPTLALPLKGRELTYRFFSLK